MHPDCRSCSDKRNCLNGTMCMKVGKYIEYVTTKPCEYENRKMGNL